MRMSRWMASTRIFWALGLASLLVPVAEARPPAKPATPSAAAAPTPNPAAEKKPQPGWTTRCQSGGRADTPDCSIEESAVLTRTGETVVAFSLRVPKDATSAAALVQIPIGIFIPSGISLQVDDKDKLDLAVQTCEQRGCLTGANLTAPFPDAMRSGKDLKVSFDNLQRQRLTVPLPLNGFGPAFDKVK